MKRLESAWLTFAAAVLPPDVGQVQRREMKRAFYAGAAMLLHEIMAMLDPGAEPTEGDLRKMDAIAQELRQFHDDVRKGAA